tara:strand:- start:400 stop:681 length:282 start_codon:yes stop_codon:yes gene_type:complete
MDINALHIVESKLKNAEECIKILREELFVNDIEHIQDIVALKYAYGHTIKETLTEMGRLDLYDFLTDKESGLNTKDFALGHAVCSLLKKCGHP